MRVALIAAAAAAVATGIAGPAWACLEIVTPKGRSAAFRAADRVVRVEALTETYVPVPGSESLRVGVATARVTDVLKGRDKLNAVITYRVVSGQPSPPACPARRGTPPGGAYTLYLKPVGDWGPPILLLPTD